MRRVGTLRAGIIVGAFMSLSACGRDVQGRTLRASLGAYEDGSGRVGLAVLATLRDDSGHGPETAWTLTLRDADGALPVTLDYTAPGPGSYVVRWRADVAPRPGTWELAATRDGETVRTTVTLGEADAIPPPPSPALSATGDAVTWARVEGAAAYLCRVYAGGVLKLEAVASIPSCDVSTLPDGAYAASISALSADPRALEVGPQVTLPARFDVAEASFAFVRGPDAAGSIVLRTAGGAYDNGVGPRSIAAWISIAGADGAATTEDWDLEITGPGLPASDPLRATYWALFPREMLWAPGVPASPGTYTVTARSATAALSSPLVVGAPAWLDFPLDVTATAGAQGSARAAWGPVAGARSYLATAYDVETGGVAMALWVGGAGVEFPAGSFVPGRAYEVLVAASDADMAWGAIVPTQVSVAENVFERPSFVAR